MIILSQILVGILVANAVDLLNSLGTVLGGYFLKGKPSNIFRGSVRVISLPLRTTLVTKRKLTYWTFGLTHIHRPSRKFQIAVDFISVCMQKRLSWLFALKRFSQRNRLATLRHLLRQQVTFLRKEYFFVVVVVLMTCYYYKSSFRWVTIQLENPIKPGERHS